MTQATFEVRERADLILRRAKIEESDRQRLDEAKIAIHRRSAHYQRRSWSILDTFLKTGFRALYVNSWDTAEKEGVPDLGRKNIIVPDLGRLVVVLSKANYDLLVAQPRADVPQPVEPIISYHSYHYPSDYQVPKLVPKMHLTAEDLHAVLGVADIGAPEKPPQL